MKVWETGMAGCKGWRVDNQETQTNWKVSSVVGHNSNVTWQVPPIWTAALLSAWLQEILGVAQDYYKSTLKWAHLTYKVKVLTKMMCVCVCGMSNISMDKSVRAHTCTNYYATLQVSIHREVCIALLHFKVLCITNLEPLTMQFFMSTLQMT